MQKANPDTFAERAIISGILQHGSNAYLEINDILNTKSFSLDINQVIYNCISDIFDNNKATIIDKHLLLSTSNTLGYTCFNNINEKKYLDTIFQVPSNIDNLRIHAQKLRKIQIANELIYELKYAKDELVEITGNESIEEIISKAETRIINYANTISYSGQTEPRPIHESIDEYIEFLKVNQNRSVGISSGYPILDRVMGGGFRPGTVTLFGARMKVGKSQLALNIAWHVSNTLKIPTLILDTEMTLSDYHNRLLSMITKININDIEQARCLSNLSKLKQITDASNIIKQCSLDRVSVSGRSFEEILAIARRWAFKRVGRDSNGKIKDCFIILDYIKTMQRTDIKDLSEHQALGFFTNALVDFALQYDIPMMALAQLNREGISKEDTSVLSQSDRIGWTCAGFFIFKPKTSEDIQIDGVSNGNRKMKDIMLRHGQPLDSSDYIHMNLDGSISTVTEIGTKYNNSSNITNEQVEFD